MTCGVVGLMFWIGAVRFDFTGSRRLRSGCMAVALGLLWLVCAPSVTRASIEEQRRRLPPAAKGCPDEIEGVWVGMEWYSGDWYRFSLHIEREEPSGERLEGRIESHIWGGTVEDVEPQACRAGVREFVIEMPSVGTFEGGQVSFEGTRWSVRENRCGTYTGVYYPDRFSGRLEQEGTEFRSVSGDGYNPDGVVVFRRVRCGPAPSTPIPDLPDEVDEGVEPPIYSRGCGGCF